jgi:hypothetical protein
VLIGVFMTLLPNLVGGVSMAAGPYLALVKISFRLHGLVYATMGLRICHLRFSYTFARVWLCKWQSLGCLSDMESPLPQVVVQLHHQFQQWLAWDSWLVGSYYQLDQ